MKRLAVPLGIIILFALAIRLPLLGIPLDRDEGEYAYIAWRAQHGELPYRDWFDQKPPAIFWVYGWALALPGDSVRTIHLMAALFVTASAVAFYFLAMYFTSPAWGLIGALMFAFLSADPSIDGMAANTELFMLLPILLSQVIVMRNASGISRRIGMNALMAGVLMGMAMAFKQVAIFNFPLLLVICWLFTDEKERARDTIIFALLSLAGAGAAWALIAAYFATHHGFNEFIYAVFSHNFAYVAATSWDVRIHRLLEALESMAWNQAIIWIIALAGLPLLVRGRSYKTLIFLVAAGSTSFAGASVSGYYFPHYFIQILPVLCLAAAIGGEEVEGLQFWRSIPGSIKHSALIMAIAILPGISIIPFLLFYSPTEAIAKIHPNDPIFGIAKDLGEHIASVTKPDDRLYIFGAEPEVFFYARRVSATRFIFLFPLYGPYADADRLQHETVEEITSNHPKVGFHFPNHLFFAEGTDQYLTNWTETYFSEHFQYETLLEIDPFDQIHLAHVPNGDLSTMADQLPYIGRLYLRKPR